MSNNIKYYYYLGSGYESVMKEVSVPMISNQRCNQPNWRNCVIRACMMCAGDVNIDPCDGDSGGKELEIEIVTETQVNKNIYLCVSKQVVLCFVRVQTGYMYCMEFIAGVDAEVR